MVSTDDYRMEYKDGGAYIQTCGERNCPVCNRILKYKSRRKRGIINAVGEKMRLMIRRLWCEDCERIHHELPDCIVPYKRHCVETIETIVNGGRPGKTDIEESTIDRIKLWWALLRLYFMSVLASLREKYGVVFSGECAPREVIRAVVNANLWVTTRSAFLSG